MIKKSFAGDFELHCDKCEFVEEGFETFMDAVAFKKDEGWKSKNNGSCWIDLCPDCANNKK